MSKYSDIGRSHEHIPGTYLDVVVDEREWYPSKIVRTSNKLSVLGLSLSKWKPSMWVRIALTVIVSMSCPMSSTYLLAFLF